MIENDHQKIGYTAVLCAKALSYNPKIPYSGEIYRKIKEKNLHRGHRVLIVLSSLGAGIFSGFGLIMSFIEARYIGMNKLLEKLNYPQILELASGFTPRGIELSNKVNIIETDLEDIVRTKKEIVNDVGFKGKYNIATLNVLDNQEFMKLGKLFNKNKPIAIIHSGLWTYLNKEEQKMLTKNIRTFLMKYSKKGCWITSDIRPQSSLKNGLFKFYRKGITKNTGRAQNGFNSEKDLNDFMDKNGFKVEVIDVMDDIYNSLNIPKKFNLKREDVTAQAQGMKIYIMRLR